MKVRYGACSDLGVRRDVNQDCYGIVEPLQNEALGRLLVVCDGMGGHAAGEVASRLGVNHFLLTFYASEQADRPALLTEAFSAANTFIYQHGRGTMGTTGVAALLLENELYVANVGDSRAYLIRDGQITQISQDHSFVAEQVAAGLITPEQARTSIHRNMITRALGHQSEVEIDLFSPGSVQVGDRVLLSTDGMHGLIEDAEIAQIVSTYPPAQAVRRLVDLANQRGGSDNITVVIAEIVDEKAPDTDDYETRELDLPETDDAEVPPVDAPPPILPPDLSSDLRVPATRPTERPLTRMGLFMALLTLLLLVSFGAWALMVQ